MIIGVILVISLPNHLKGPTRMKFWYIFGMRILMGIGIGGDYPMSAAIVAERSSLRNRGRMLGWIFSNQGWVSRANCTQTSHKQLMSSSGYPGRIDRHIDPPRMLQQIAKGWTLQPTRRCLASSNRSRARPCFRDTIFPSHHAREQEVPAIRRAQHLQSPISELS